MYNPNGYITFCDECLKTYEVFSICQGYAFTIRSSEMKERIHPGVNNLEWMVCCFAYSGGKSKWRGMCVREKENEAEECWKQLQFIKI